MATKKQKHVLYRDRSISSSLPTLAELFEKGVRDNDETSRLLPASVVVFMLQKLGWQATEEEIISIMVESGVVTDTSDRLRFGDFCEVVEYWRRRSGSPGRRRKQPRKEVFLGGSCNPTTWRRDIAIPMLSAAEVSYYNPQVADWSPELVAIEAEAKEDAKILLFVIDGATRAISSMIEVAELIASGRKVVLVIQNIKEDACICGEAVLANARKDLNRGRAYLADVAARHGVIVFETIKEAVQQCIDLLEQGGHE